MTIVGSTKLLAWLLAGLEKPYSVGKLEALPVCNAVVVLGGTHSFDSNGVYDIDFNSNVDGIIMAAELVRTRKGKALVIGGGGYPTKDGLQPAGIMGSG